MLRWNRYIWLALFCIGISISASAQNKTKKEILEQKKVKLQDEIDLANEILKDTRSTKQSGLMELQTLRQKISIREELLRTLNREIDIIDSEIEEQQQSIEDLEKQIDELKAQYAGMIRQAYKSQSKTDRLLFIFSSTDFNQAIHRISYLRQYSEFRKRQVGEIQNVQEQLEFSIANLNQQKKDKERLKFKKEQEKETLVTDRAERETVLASLAAKEGQLKNEISSKQKEAKKLEAEIGRIIALEMKKAAEKAERENLLAEAKKAGLVSGKDFNSKTSNKALLAKINAANKAKGAPEKVESAVPAFAMTPESRQLAANFVANKGKLPWPVERGIIVTGFGRQVITGDVVIDNPYIEIATQKGAEARAAFDGEVTSVIRIPGANKAVMIRHGNYFSVYTNLIDVVVKKGDKVTVKQPLGTVFTDPNDQRTILQFGIWKEQKVQDPKPWLFKN
jgi:septal ring factor EnvC (AmiA/AmiB activator)